MTELDPCLAGCDSALAEAELLLAMLGESAAADPGLERVTRSLEALRREVDRLRGIKVVPPRRQTDPFATDLSNGESPWTTRDRRSADPA